MTDITNDPGGQVQGRQRLAVAAGAALLVAGLVLVMFVLPAEYGVDPLGTGARTGLLELGVTGQQVDALNAAAAAGTSGAAPIIVAQERAFHEDTMAFPLKPGESIEYKYRLEQGEALLFSWSTGGGAGGGTGGGAVVNYELHAEPDGAPRGFAESYEKGQGAAASGTLTAPFSGIHGWYWENSGDQDVTVTLTAAGFFTVAHEFRAGAPVKNKLFQ